ncbi:MAG TPA: sigma-54 dependent transcriptional regulator [Thermoanaerobaculia bacterium]|nr:sigma-54 dependent transcriptional regulator [Thermoanaerobaculia bacterium]
MTVAREAAAATRPEGVAGSVLLVDDEAYVRESLCEILVRRGFDVRTATSGAEALESGRLDGVEAVVSDLKMPGIDGLSLVTELSARAPGLPVIVLTAHGTVASAVECLQAGAADYLLKPVDAGELVLALERALKQAARRRELAYLRDARVRTGADGSGAEGPIGRSAAWLEVMRLVDLVAPTDTSVLLIGESGTGKEEVARLLHRLGRRRDESLVVVNCAAIPAELFESELFGHRRGSFTGAIADREGRFHIAHRGTLVLDEVNSLPLHAQAKLLRVLQDGAFERVGDSRPTRVDVRLICASNVDLEAEVEAGRFRSDLFYRINVVTLSIPPLRERPEDIALLANAFVRELAGRLDRGARELAPEALEALEGYPWPGNVRELRNVIERAVLLAPGEWIDAGALPFAPTSVPASATPSTLNLRERLRAAERQTLVAALDRAGGVRREAAKLLGIDERNLPYYLHKHGLMGWRPAERS